jgi:integrase
MTQGLARALDHPWQGHHAPEEVYQHFVDAYTTNHDYRIELLYERRRFIRRYPDLGEWFAAPLAERVGRLYQEPMHQATDLTNSRARIYLMFLAIHGYARFDWEWLLAVGRLGLPTVLAHLHLETGIEDLLTLAKQLGYEVGGRGIAGALSWTTTRIFLHTGQFTVGAIGEADLQAAREAITLFGQRPDLALYCGSAEHYETSKRNYQRFLYELHLLLYHRGQVGSSPRIVHPVRHVVSLNPRMEAVVTRYLTARQVTDRPESVQKSRQALRCLIAWLAQTYPQIETFADLSRDHLLEFAAALATRPLAQTNQPYAANTRRRLLSCLSVFFQDVAAWQWEGVPAHPLLGAGDLPKRPLRLPRAIPDAELAPLMEAIRGLPCPFQRAALLIARWSGARRGEIQRLEVDCLDSYPDGTPRLRIPVGKTNRERMVPLNEEAAQAIRALQAQWNGGRGFPDEQTGRVARYLFMNHGKQLGRRYLFEAPLRTICQATGLLTAEGKPTITMHRFRHTVGTQLTNCGARLQTIMKVLGHQSANMALVYAQISDQEVLSDYQTVLGPGATLAGPSAEALRSGDLSMEAVNWLKTNFFKTELELGRCLRLPQEGPCECDFYLTCAKFVTTPAYTPRLRRRRRTEQELIEDALAHGWHREVERHRCTIQRLDQLLAELGESLDGPEAMS